MTFQNKMVKMNGSNIILFTHTHTERSELHIVRWKTNRKQVVEDFVGLVYSRKLRSVTSNVLILGR
jgi:hypothetical protein